MVEIHRQIISKAVNFYVKYKFANLERYTLSYRSIINSINGACTSLTPENAVNGAYTLTPVTVSQFVMRPNSEKKENKLKINDLIDSMCK